MTAQALAVQDVISPPQVPVGVAGQLGALADQLVRARRIVGTAQAAALATMRDPDLEAPQRRAAVARLRTLLWKVSREILPLVHRVPAGMRGHRAYRECLRAYEDLRRVTEEAMGVHANCLVDLSLEQAAVGR